MHDNPNARLQRKFNRELKKAFGSRLDSEFGPPTFEGGATDADVQTILDTDTIKTIRGNSGNPIVKIMHQDSSADAVFHSAYEDLNGGGSLKAAQPQSGTIKLYSGSFLSPRHLANTILHEMGHAYSRYTGGFFKSFKKFGWERAVYLDEIYAYTFANQFGVSYFESPGLYQRGLRKAIHELGLNW